MGKPKRNFDDSKPNSLVEDFVHWHMIGHRKNFSHMNLELRRYMMKQLAPYVRLAKTSQRFRIDALAADTLSKMKKSKVEQSDIMPFLHLPYDRMWVELGMDVDRDVRAQFCAEDDAGFRVGIVLEQEASDRITAMLIHEKVFANGSQCIVSDGAPLIISPYGIAYDEEYYEEFTSSMHNKLDVPPHTLEIMKERNAKARMQIETQASKWLVNLLLLLNSRSSIFLMSNRPENQECANRFNERNHGKGTTAKLPLGNITFNISRFMKDNPDLSEEQAYIRVMDQLVRGHFRGQYETIDGQKSLKDIHWIDAYVRNKSRPGISVDDSEPRQYNVTRASPHVGRGFDDSSGTGLPVVDYKKV